MELGTIFVVKLLEESVEVNGVGVKGLGGNVWAKRLGEIVWVKGLAVIDGAKGLGIMVEPKGLELIGFKGTGAKEGDRDL